MGDSQFHADLQQREWVNKQDPVWSQVAHRQGRVLVFIGAYDRKRSALFTFRQDIDHCGAHGIVQVPGALTLVTPLVTPSCTFNRGVWIQSTHSYDRCSNCAVFSNMRKIKRWSEQGCTICFSHTDVNQSRVYMDASNNTSVLGPFKNIWLLPFLLRFPVVWFTRNLSMSKPICLIWHLAKHLTLRALDIFRSCYFANPSSNSHTFKYRKAILFFPECRDELVDVCDIDENMYRGWTAMFVALTVTLKNCSRS